MRYFLGIAIALAAFLLGFDTVAVTLWMTRPAVTVTPPCYEHVAGFVLPAGSRWC